MRKFESLNSNIVHRWSKSFLFNLRNILISFILVSWPVVTISSELPDLGSPASLILSPQDEQNLAREVLGEISQTLKLSHDPVVNDYLHAIGYRLVATHRSDPRSYTFFAIDDNNINAFAVPGGMIGVNTGLILASNSESELAGVLAHEVAHVHLKHIARLIEHMGRVRISNIAGILASIILATQNPQAGQGALVATMAGSTQSIINFTRDNEKEADLVGIQSLAAAGFDPRGMPEFFRKLSQNTRYYGRDIPEYLRTHPLTESRLMEATRRAQEYPYRQIEDSLHFHLVKARVQVSQMQVRQAVETFEDAVTKRNYTNEQGAKYGYALALYEAKDPRSKTVIMDLIKQNPNQSLYQLALGDILWQQGDKQLAIQQLEKSLKNHPHNHPISMSLADKLIEQNQNPQAITLLLNHRLQRPNDGMIYHLLSKAYAQDKNLGSSHRYEAEYRYYMGDLHGALTQLRMASQYVEETDTLSKKIFARRKEIESILAREYPN